MSCSNCNSTNLQKEHDKAKSSAYLYGSIGAAALAFLFYRFTRK